MRNDYKVIYEKKYYVVFTDGQGKEQKIEISKEVAQVIQGEQTKENTIRRSEERIRFLLTQWIMRETFSLPMILMNWTTKSRSCPVKKRFVRY